MEHMNLFAVENYTSPVRSYAGSSTQIKNRYRWGDTPR